jgi:hypothetical protein
MGQWGGSPLRNVDFMIGLSVDRTVVLAQKSIALLCFEHSLSEAGRYILVDGTVSWIVDA